MPRLDALHRPGPGSHSDGGRRICHGGGRNCAPCDLFPRPWRSIPARCSVHRWAREVDEGNATCRSVASGCRGRDHGGHGSGNDHGPDDGLLILAAPRISNLCPDRLKAGKGSRHDPHLHAQGICFLPFGCLGTRFAVQLGLNECCANVGFEEPVRIFEPARQQQLLAPIHGFNRHHAENSASARLLLQPHGARALQQTGQRP